MIFEYLYRKIFERGFSLTLSEFAELWEAKRVMNALKELNDKFKPKGWYYKIKTEAKEQGE